MEEYDITSKEIKTLVDIHIQTARSLERVALTLRDISEEQKAIKSLLIQDQKDFINSVQKIIDIQVRTVKDMAEKMVVALAESCNNCKADYLKPVKKDMTWLKIILGSAGVIAILAKLLLPLLSPSP